MLAGLGKTVQALAIAAAYKDEWPGLIITPSSLRCASHIPKWKIFPKFLMRRNGLHFATFGHQPMV